MSGETMDDLFGPDPTTPTGDTHVPINPHTGVGETVYALIFNGVTAASSAATDERDWIRLSERERIAEAVYASLRAGNIEFRLGGLALLARVAAGQPAEGEPLPPPKRRIRACMEAWPECYTGGYDPRCCRFPKSCSATSYDPEQVTDEYLEPAATTPAEEC
jgi:hypothetical protein